MLCVQRAIQFNKISGPFLSEQYISDDAELQEE